MRVGFGGVGALDGGDLFADAAEFFIERRLIGEQCGEFFVPLPQLVLQLLQFFQRLPVSGRRGACAAFGVEGQPRRRFFAASVGVRQPVSDVEEFAGRGEGVELPHWAVAVHGEVAEFFDDPDLGEDRWTDGVAEGGLVDEGAEVILIGELKGGVVLVEPVDRQLEGAAGVEARGAGVRMDQLLGLNGGRVDVGPFGLEEIELAHGPRGFPASEMRAGDTRLSTDPR